MAIAADNYAVEAVPPSNTSGARPFVPLHGHCVFKLGIHRGELWYLDELQREVDATRTEQSRSRGIRAVRCDPFLCVSLGRLVRMN